MVRGIAVGIVGVALALAACGGEGQTTTGGEGQTTTENGRAVPPIATDTAPAGAGKTEEVPHLVGKRLPAATGRLNQLGLHYQAVSDTQAVEGGSNWEVCKVSPHAGIVVPLAARIEIVVARPGKCAELVPDVARPKRRR